MCTVTFLLAKVHVSTILDSPLGKATVKAESITDIEEERVAADKASPPKTCQWEGSGRVWREGVQV